MQEKLTDDKIISDKKKKEIVLIIVLIAAVALVISSFIRDRRPRELDDKAKQEIIEALLKKNEGQERLTEEERTRIVNELLDKNKEKVIDREGSQEIIEQLKNAQ